MIYAVFNQKGGSGKTMTAVHLAVCAYTAGDKVAILDVDEQGSATAWHKARGDVAGPTVVGIPVGSLARAIEGAKADGFEFILIDCPPSVTPSTAQIIKAADFVLIPVRPEPLDLAAIPATLKLINGKPFGFLLSDCPQRAPEIDETRQALAKIGPVLGQVNNWRSMWRALVSGQAVCEFEPDSVAAAEVQAVYQKLKAMQ